LVNVHRRCRSCAGPIRFEICEELGEWHAEAFGDDCKQHTRSYFRHRPIEVFELGEIALIDARTGGERDLV